MAGARRQARRGSAQAAVPSRGRRATLVQRCRLPPGRQRAPAKRLHDARQAGGLQDPVHPPLHPAQVGARGARPAGRRGGCWRAVLAGGRRPAARARRSRPAPAAAKQAGRKRARRAAARHSVHLRVVGHADHSVTQHGGLPTEAWHGAAQCSAARRRGAARACRLSAMEAAKVRSTLFLPEAPSSMIWWFRKMMRSSAPCGTAAAALNADGGRSAGRGRRRRREAAPAPLFRS